MTTPPKERLPVTPGEAMPKGEWTVEYTPSSPMKGRRRGERTYAQANLYSGELIEGGRRCYADGTEGPLYREVIYLVFNDQDPASVARAKAICSLVADAGTTYNRIHMLPSEMADKLEEAVKLAKLFLQEFDDVPFDTPIAYYKVEKAARAFLSQFPTPQTNSEG